MAKRKTGGKKKQKKTSGRSGSQKTYLKRIVAGLAFLILFVVAAGLLAHHLILRKQPLHRVRPAEKSRIYSRIHKWPVHKKPAFEIYPKEKIPSRKPIHRPEAILPKKLPKVAIIIDDLGYDKVIAEKFLKLDAVFTFSVLPHSTFQESIARAAGAKGIEIMLHLPMEPIEYPEVDPGPGALLTTMSPDQLISQLKKDLDAVPSIKGVNNHMGSKMTAVSTQMYQIFSVLKKRDLFFIDSLTTSESLCKPSARLLRVPFAQRDVFLDHIQEADFIRKQIKSLLRIADSHGEAVGIAHPYTVTYEILRELLPDIQKKVVLVPASEIVHAVGYRLSDK